jgi:hypothetical protein
MDLTWRQVIVVDYHPIIAKYWTQTADPLEPESNLSASSDAHT